MTRPDEVPWASIRLGKFYEALDALTGDAACTHCDAVRNGLALVTAGHYHSIKLGRTIPNRDVHIRSCETP